MVRFDCVFFFGFFGCEVKVCNIIFVIIMNKLVNEIGDGKMFDSRIILLSSVKIILLD